MDANDNNAPKIVAALQYDAGAEHRPALDGFTSAVIAVRFVSISQLLTLHWAFSSLAGLLTGQSYDEPYIVGSLVAAGFAIVTSVLLWLFAEPVARAILPKQLRVGSSTPVNVQYAAIGIALIGMFSVVEAVPFLLSVIAGFVTDLWRGWYPSDPGSAGIVVSSGLSSTWYDVHQRVITLAVSLAQLLLGLLLILCSRRLARWRFFRG